MSGFPVTINGTTYNASDFSPYGYVAKFPAIFNDLAAVAAGIAAVAGSGGVVPNGQLAFPATQNPSSNVNTLDDYEEGTWTPVLKFGGASVGVTYSGQVGRYQKVGNRVHLKCDVSLSNKGSSTGAATITGAPFVPAADGAVTTVSSVSVVYAQNITCTGVVIAMILNNVGVSTIFLYVENNGSAAALADSGFANTTSFELNLTFEVSA